MAPKLAPKMALAPSMAPAVALAPKLAPEMALAPKEGAINGSGGKVAPWRPSGAKEGLLHARATVEAVQFRLLLARNGGG